MAAGVYYLRTQSSRQPEAIKSLITPKVVLTTSPTPIVVITPTIVVVASKDEFKKQAKETIEGIPEIGLAVDTLDVTSTGSSSAFFGHSTDWKKYGLYLYDFGGKKITPVYELNESLIGRGGTYTDSVDVQFSENGQNFFANKTGTNFPSFIVSDNTGKILYKSSDLGNATWISSDKILYIKALDKNPEVFDMVTKKSSSTNFPKGIFHLMANKSGTYVAAYSVAKKTLQCPSFDLEVFSNPAGNLVKEELNVDLTAYWVDDYRIAIDKVIDCKKNSGESMSEYSPVSERREIIVQ